MTGRNAGSTQSVASPAMHALTPTPPKLDFPSGSPSMPPGPSGVGQHPSQKCGSGGKVTLRTNPVGPGGVLRTGQPGTSSCVPGAQGAAQVGKCPITPVG